MVDLSLSPHILWSELSEVLWQQIMHFGYTLSVDLPPDFVWLNTILQIIVVFAGFAGWAGMVRSVVYPQLVIVCVGWVIFMIEHFFTVLQWVPLVSC